MVSFTSITSGALLVSMTLLLGTAEAAPSSGRKGSALEVAPHANSTAIESSFEFPPIITSRTRFEIPSFKGDINAESESIEKNKKWVIEHGGDLNYLAKRDIETVDGMTLDLPTQVPPKPKPSGSSVVTATSDQKAQFELFAGIASTAYCKSVIFKREWDCKNCLKYVPDGKLIKVFDTVLDDTNGFVLRSDSQKTIHLVFRGTNSFRSAIVDAQFLLTPYSPVKKAKVHFGFLASYDLVAPQFFPVIQEQLTTYPDYKVVVSGHSLGGAQALLAGMDLYQREKRLSPSNLSIYTVGCPRVGNPAFAYYVDSTGIPFSRSVNERDVVPHVPTQLMGYLHPGVEAWSTSGTVKICTPNIETKDCSNSITPFTSILDHLNYYGINEGLCA